MENFNEVFWAWLEKDVGVPFPLMQSLEKDDDWTFVVKIQGVVEAGLNHLLVSTISAPGMDAEKLRKLVAFLPAADERIGKIAFLNAFNLLTEDARLFVRLFANLRNDSVHKISNFGFTLRGLLDGLESAQKKNWKRALASWVGDSSSDDIKDTAFKHPREAIWNCCAAIMIHSRKGQLSSEERMALHDLLMRV